MSETKTQDEERPTRVAAPFLVAELEAIDAWGFSRRIRNRSDAIKALIKAGLEATTEPAS